MAPTLRSSTRKAKARLDDSAGANEESPQSDKSHAKLRSIWIWNGTWLGSDWVPSQRSLYLRKKRDRLNLFFDLIVLVISISSSIIFCPSLEPLPNLSIGRAFWITVNAMCSIFTRICSNNVMPPVDEKTEPVITGIFGPIGSAAFLTYQSTTFFALYATVTAMCELSIWWLQYSNSDGNIEVLALEYISRVLHSLYIMSPFFQGLGVVLTLLWLKFNWFEEKWQKTVVQFWQNLGFHAVVQVQWFGHSTLPLALIDIFLCKPGASMAAVMISNRTLVTIVASYTTLYMGMTLFLKTINGGNYPYPFLDNICAKWWSTAVFTIIIAVLNSLVCTAVRNLSLML